MVPDPVNIPGWLIWEQRTRTAPLRTTIDNNINLIERRKTMPKSKSQRQDSDAGSSLSDTALKLVHYLQAGYPGLYFVSPEEQRVEGEIKLAAQSTKFGLHVWSASEGLLDTQKKTLKECNDPMELLMAVDELPEKSVLLLKDFHLFLHDPNPILIRKLKDVLLLAKTKSKTLIILGCRLVLPPELEREFTVIEFALPGKEQLNHVLQGIVESANLKPAGPDETEQILDAASGLTTMEAENAFALSVVQSKRIDPAVVAKEKAQAVKKNGLLELIETTETLESIGGLDVLKDWLLKRRHAFSTRAKDYGLPALKGILILGLPGTGKSLTAKATAKVFGVPLLKLDAGRIFAGLVGQSESNLRSVIQTAEAIAPCCLWVDELEKGLAGSKSSGSTDGGTSSRVFGSFISWLQEKRSPVFVVATANDVSQLPPELLRKGRFDELMFVDLPNQTEREAIWQIQISKYRRNPEEFDVVQLSRATEGLTGAEIEQVFVESLFQAFDAGREPTDLIVAGVLTEFVPLSKLMGEQISALRSWVKGRARLATSVSEESGLRRVLG
jgi:hypothetical protein